MKKTLPVIVYFTLFAFTCMAQAPNWQWARGSTGDVQCEGWSAATDAVGNVYVIGTFYNGAATFGTTTISDPSNAVEVLYLAKYDATGNFVWVKALDTCAGFVYAIAIDGNNNIYVTGSFQSDTAKFGPYALVNAGSGSNDIFIARYDTAGNVIWAKRAGGFASDAGQGIATDNNSNVFVTGYFWGNLTWGPDTIHSGNNGAGFIAKYNTAGNVAWARAIGTNTGALGYSTATDADGNVLVTGAYIIDSITFGNTTFYNGGYNNTSDIFLAKYDTAGNLLWAKATGGDGNDQGNWVTTDKDGNIYITGFFSSDSITFGNTTLYNACPIATCGGSADVFMCKYNTAGNLLWANRYGGTSNDEGYSMATDTHGNVYATGMFYSDSIAFDSTTLIKPLIGTDPSFLIVCDTGGHVHYAESFSSGGDDQSVVCIDRQGNGFFVGDFVLSPFGIGPDTLLGPPDTTVFFDDENMFVARFKYGKGGPSNIQSLEESQALMLYPNPFTKTATVQYTLPAGTKNAALIIYDMVGHVMSRYQLSNAGGQINIDATSLTGGMYLYALVTDGSLCVTKKMIVE